MYNPVLIEIYYNGKLDISYIPQDALTMAEVVDNAKKTFSKKHGVDLDSIKIKSLPINKRKSIDDIEDSIKESWPKGIKTINVQSFEVKIYH